MRARIRAERGAVWADSKAASEINGKCHDLKTKAAGINGGLCEREEQTDAQPEHP